MRKQSLIILALAGACQAVTLQSAVAAQEGDLTTSDEQKTEEAQLTAEAFVEDELNLGAGQR